MSRSVVSGKGVPSDREPGVGLALVRILNFHDLLAVYDDVVLDDIAAFIDSQLAEWEGAGPMISLEGPYFVFDPGVSRAIDAYERDVLAERINALIGFGPVVCGAEEAFLHVQTTFIARDDPAPLPGEGRRMLPYDARWVVGRTKDEGGPASAYKADMAVAIKLFSQLSARALTLAFQPVVAAGANNSVIYWEALLRLDSDDVEAGHSTCTSGIVALERLGLVSRIDRSVIWAVLGLLEQHKGIQIACNVSARSLKPDAWWRLLFQALGQRPEAASRLIIELTETSAITQEDEAFAILQTLRGLGCKIAVDDFGAGCSTLDFVVRFRPSFIKIDKTYLPSTPALPSGESSGLLRNLVALCRCLCPCVIAKGIESELHRSEAIEAGAQGLQGYLFGMPHVLPYWLREPVVVRDAFEPGHPSHTQSETVVAHVKV
ncbi:EAL domain-containing protein [Parapusillimonas sp. SGNA-6]|nr:EAL domain-containing protein [Parapusillimonas sp. SGNA-6]